VRVTQNSKLEAPAALDLESEVGARIRALRKARGMSQQQLGEALAAYGHGMRHELVYRVEAGSDRRPLRLNEAAAFAAALGVTLADLIGGGGGDQAARQAALTATIETSQQLAEAIEAAEKAQQRYTEARQRAQKAQRQAEEAQQQAEEAARELGAATRRRSDALVAYELASMRWNAGRGR
jgi:transcriptional regulator with XRE-family HTH domain